MYKIKLYDKIKNDVNNTYVYKANTKIVDQEHKKLNYIMQIICHMKKEKNINQGNLINIRVLNPLIQIQQKS